ncbi:hypothetical protein ZWY2020_021289 [Hordeum vulgare]|nr:hypothetical protein ZWY2020_021289 [Hordeum vulgare]
MGLGQGGVGVEQGEGGSGFVYRGGGTRGKESSQPRVNNLALTSSCELHCNKSNTHTVLVLIMLWPWKSESKSSDSKVHQDGVSSCALHQYDLTNLLASDAWLLLADKHRILLRTRQCLSSFLSTRNFLSDLDTSWCCRGVSSTGNHGPPENVAPRPRVVTEEDRCRNRRREPCLIIAEMDEHAMAEWRRQFPQDILDERQIFAQRRVERVERRAEQATYHEDRRTQKQAALFQMELKEASTWSCDDECWVDAFITTEGSDTDALESDDDDEE